MGPKSKNQILTNFKASKSENTTKNKWWQNSKTQIMTKLKKNLPWQNKKKTHILNKINQTPKLGQN